MKKILLIGLLFSLSVFAAKKEDTLELNVHVNKMQLTAKNLYRLELAELAAAYHAEEKFVPCLKQAISEKKEITLTVTTYTLMVQDCK